MTATRKPPANYSAVRLERMLVGDALNGHPTEIAWAAEAYVTIGRKRWPGLGDGKAAERAHVEVVRTVRDKGGVMPLAPLHGV